ncbi:fused MFS/spermidine synthase [bacterium]|nr:fused MFS/spermidine synthase [bacterium]
MTAQIILMREMLSIFFGNELAAGILLAVWLLWTGIGSAAGGRGAFKKTGSLTGLFSLQILWTLLLPATLLLLHAVPVLFKTVPGELPGFIPMLSTALLTLAPFSILSGLLFVRACAFMGAGKKGHGKAVGLVYWMEAAGAAIGGIGASLVLVPRAGPMTSALCLVAVNSAAAFYAARCCGMRGKRFPILVSLSGILAALAAVCGAQNRFDRWIWREFELQAVRDSAYGRITAVRMGGQITFFQNGMLFFTSPNPLASEYAVHPALLSHQAPEKVLIIGGGPGGMLSEALKHPSVRHVDFVEFDREITRLARDLLQPEHALFLDDPRVTVRNMDGRRFVKQATEPYDVIISNMPNPGTALINRFYTIEYFREVRGILAPQGVFSLEVRSAENAIGEELAGFLKSLRSSLMQAFPQAILLPGESGRFLCSLSSKNPFELDTLLYRLEARAIRTDFFNASYLGYDYSTRRLDYVRERTDSAREERLNRDDRPIGFYFDMVLWAVTFSAGFKRLFESVSRIPLWFLFILPAAGIAALRLVMNKIRPGRRSGPAALFSVFTAGCTGMGAELVLILVYQSWIGYAYRDLAVILSGFMVGLSLGGGLSNRMKAAASRRIRFLAACQAGMALSLALLAWAVHGLGMPLSAFPNPLFPALLFPASIFIIGAVCGFQFVLACRLYATRPQDEKRAGLLYGMDLLGSATGALCISAFMIPIWGFGATLLVLSTLNLCAAALVRFSGIRPEQNSAGKDLN